MKIMGESVQGNKGEDSVLDAWKNNTLRSLQTPEDRMTNLQISGPKVDSFMKNLLGVVHEVTNDAWMANYANVDQELFASNYRKLADEQGKIGQKGSGYLAMSAAARKAADIASRKTGETWTPAEIQETIWSWAKALYEMRAERGGKTTTSDLLKSGELTSERVNSVPDFEKLFVQNAYRKILEDAGYGDQLKEQERVIGSREGSDGGNGAGVDTFDAEGSGFAQPDFQRQLLRAARRLEDLYQTRLTNKEATRQENLGKVPTTPDALKSVELSGKAPEYSRAQYNKAISNDPVGKGVQEEKSSRWDNIWDKTREFFDPLALVPNLPVFTELRNIVVGSQYRVEENARTKADAIRNAIKGDKAQAEAIYNYLTTRNADASLISNLDARKAAVEAKASINKVGKDAVANGFISQKSLDDYYDRYLPRLYMQFVAEGKGQRTPFMGLTEMGYRKMRDTTMSEEERNMLGEIKDPAYLTYVALSRPARDIAIANYFKNILLKGPENDWIYSNALVNYNGKEIPAFTLKKQAETLREVVIPATEALDPKQADIMRREADKMDQLANAKNAEISGQEKAMEAAGYERIPENSIYGMLAGVPVKKGIYNDIVGIFNPVPKKGVSIIQRIAGDEHSTLNAATKAWKMGKVALNPPSMARNIVSNMFAMHMFAGISPLKMPELVMRAIKERNEGSTDWNNAIDYGLKGTTFASQELKQTYDAMLAYNKANGGNTGLFGNFALARIMAKNLAQKGANFYGEIESTFKFATYLDGIDKGMKPSAAMDRANDALFDYSRVDPNIRALRNAPIVGMPFITYNYKVLPKMFEVMRNNPERILPYVAFAAGLPAIAMAQLNMNSDELDSMRKTLSDQVKNKGSLYFLPFRDSEGHVQYVDLGPYLPWSNLTDPFYEAYQNAKEGDIGNIGKQVVSAVTPSTPVAAALVALTTGLDPLTGRPIMDPRDTAQAKAASLVSWMWNQATPPILGVDLKNPQNSPGVVAKLYEQYSGDLTEKTRKGLPTPDTMQTALRLLGANIAPLDPARSRAQNLLFMQNDLNKEKGYITQVSRDQSLTPEQRRARIMDLQQVIRDKTQKMAEYARDTSAGVQASRRTGTQ
jgi:hypothetical protein